MARVASTFAAAALVLLTAACGVGGADAPRANEGMPANVPTQPEYEAAEDVRNAMGQAGLECDLLRRTQTRFSSRSDCVAVIDGVRVENEIHVLDPRIHVLDPREFSRSDIGDSIASRRGSLYGHTIVAAGNWYVWVKYADFAPQVAKALEGVTLRALEPPVLGARLE